MDDTNHQDVIEQLKVAENDAKNILDQAATAPLSLVVEQPSNNLENIKNENRAADIADVKPENKTLKEGSASPKTSETKPLTPLETVSMETVSMETVSSTTPPTPVKPVPVFDEKRFKEEMKRAKDELIRDTAHLADPPNIHLETPNVKREEALSKTLNTPNVLPSKIELISKPADSEQFFEAPKDTNQSASTTSDTVKKESPVSQLRRPEAPAGKQIFNVPGGAGVKGGMSDDEVIEPLLIKETPTPTALVQDASALLKATTPRQPEFGEPVQGFTQGFTQPGTFEPTLPPQIPSLEAESTLPKPAFKTAPKTTPVNPPEAVSIESEKPPKQNYVPRSTMDPRLEKLMRESMLKGAAELSKGPVNYEDILKRINSRLSTAQLPGNKIEDIKEIATSQAPTAIDETVTTPEQVVNNVVNLGRNKNIQPNMSGATEKALLNMNKSMDKLTTTVQQTNQVLVKSIQTLNNTAMEILRSIPDGNLPSNITQSRGGQQNRGVFKPTETVNQIGTFRNNLGLTPPTYAKNTVFPGNRNKLS